MRPTLESSTQIPSYRRHCQRLHMPGCETQHQKHLRWPESSRLTATRGCGNQNHTRYGCHRTGSQSLSRRPRLAFLSQNLASMPGYGRH